MNISPSQTNQTRWLGLTALVLAVTAGGCSWAFMKPLPEDPAPSYKPDCGADGLQNTDGMFAGIFLGASGMGFGSWAIARQNEDSILPPEVNLASAIAYSIPVLIFSASALTGLVRSNRCKAQAERYLAWRAKHPQEAQAQDGQASTPAADEPARLASGQVCPAGAQAVGDAPPLGFETHCAQKKSAGEMVAHGPQTTWYANGTKSSQGQHHLGQRHGDWVFWYDSGIKKLEAHYDRGKQIGHWIYWDRQGEIFRQVDFPQPQGP